MIKPLNRLPALLLAAGFLFLPIGVQAADIGMLKYFDALSMPIRVVLNNDLMDDCLPQPQSLKDVYEKELRHLGFRIAQEGESGATFSVATLGGATYNKVGLRTGCLAMLSVQFDIYAPVAAPDGTTPMMMIQAYHASGLIDSGENSLQIDLEDGARPNVNTFYLVVLGAKD